MLRKSLAILLSGAWLLVSTAASAASATEAAKVPPVPATTRTPDSAKYQPPLPPGGALDIKKAQGGDLGIGVILLSWAAAGGLLFWIFSSIDNDDDSSSGTN